MNITMVKEKNKAAIHTAHSDVLSGTIALLLTHG